MGKSLVCIGLFLGGIAYMLYSWVAEQKKRERQLEELIFFLEKLNFAMKERKCRVISFLESYPAREESFARLLKALEASLKYHRYPRGEEAWVAAVKDQGYLSYKEELQDLVLKAGGGIFGMNLEENVHFLKISIKELKDYAKKEKQKVCNDRKVWIPVSLLGGAMLIIIWV